MKLRSVQNLIQIFSKMPAIGSKTAERMALYVSRANAEEVRMLLKAIQDVSESVQMCKRCHFLSEGELCTICSNDQRNGKSICVVEHNEDVLSIEKTQAFQGVYHVLGGVFSPLDGIGPSDINVGSLMNRLRNYDVSEVIIATNPTANGEITSSYIVKAVQSLDKSICVSRIGLGVAMGSELAYVDKLTMSRSLESRTQLV